MQISKKILNIIFIIVFMIIIAIPIFFSDFEGGKISTEENRTLEKFPDLYGENSVSIKDTPEALESWCGDNIGFRDVFFSLYRTFTYRILGISPTSDVHVGKDGWLFYTPIHNVDIGSGEYFLSEETLELIAKNQQTISDYYASQGKTYYFLLVPSKASVYPEKLSGTNLEIGYTLIDQVEEYIRNNTTVNVINVKDALCAAKDEGHLLYWKTDTHWSPYGAYVAYLEIMERLASDGLIDNDTLTPVFDMAPEGVHGDLAVMLGQRLVEKEKSVYPAWNKNFVYDTESEEYYNISAALDLVSNSPIYEAVRSEKRMLNESSSANGKSLLIYGDSMMMDANLITQYLAEEFSEVQYVRVRLVSEDIDREVEPDVVIFEVTERLVEHVCVKEPTSIQAKALVDSRVETEAQVADIWIGENGMRMDMSESYVLSADYNHISLKQEFDSYYFAGWAIDYPQKNDLGNLFLKVGDRYISTNYGISSPDIAHHFQTDEFDKSRFSFTLSKKFIEDNAITELQFVMISADGIHKYPIQSYTLDFF